MSPEPDRPESALPQLFDEAEWAALVASAVATVADWEATEEQARADAADADALAEAAIAEMLEAQPGGGRAFSLPIAAGASSSILTWHNRAYWLRLCQWVVTHTERGRAALKRHGIAAGTFMQGCEAHAAVADSRTGRRVAACLDTLIARSGLSREQLRRCRRVMRALELGVEQARGKLLNGLEREAAARLYEQAYGQAPTRPQRGAASVWNLSAPQWAVEAMPAPTRKPRPRQRSRRRTARAPHNTTAPTRPVTSAPQSSRGFSCSDLPLGKDHLMRTQARAGETISTTSTRPLNLQRAAAELVARIPALRAIMGVDELTGQRRGHIGSVCNLVVTAGIDTDRWTGGDIAQALSLDGVTRGWTWPSSDAMTSPLGLLAWRLAQLDWSGISPTERNVRSHQDTTEVPASAAYRLVKARRTVVAASETTQTAPASAEHRRAMRAQFAATLVARKAEAAAA